MKLTKNKYEKIKHLMPKARKPSIENGCKWRALPEKYGKWHTIYMRFNRWAKKGTIQRIFEQLQDMNIIENRTDVLCIGKTKHRTFKRRIDNEDPPMQQFE